MGSHNEKRFLNNPLLTGLLLVLLSFFIACILWPLWSLASHAIYSTIADVAMSISTEQQHHHLLNAFSEGTFFWMMITAWIWLSIVIGTYGKTALTTKQPLAGIYYTVVGWGVGILAFFVLISIPGMWWKPFSLAIMFTPQSSQEIDMAIKAWETSNLFVLAVIITQIPLSALLQRWPFTRQVENLNDHLSVLFLGIAITWMAWMSLIVPSHMHFTMAGQEVFNKPFGNWLAFSAFCQAYVLFAIMPVEGAELYPMKYFTKKQPAMGIIGFIIAVAAGFLLPPLVRFIIEPINLIEGMPIDALVSSLELSVIVFMLTWHHLFNDYPSAEKVPNSTLRVWIRIAIWFIGGSAFGVIWLKTYHLLPFGTNDLGLGITPLSIITGQFALLMVILMLNTFFDKWPIIRSK